MDKRKFREFIESVAEIKVVTPTKDQYGSADGIYMQGDVEVEITQDDNPTLGFKLIKVKPISKLCEMGCGLIVDNQKIECRLSEYPKPHWKTKCSNCGKYLAPNGVDLLEDANKAQAAFLWHLRDKK